MTEDKKIKLTKDDLWDLIIALDYRVKEMCISKFNISYIVSHHTPYKIYDIVSPLKNTFDEEKNRLEALKHKLIIFSGAESGRHVFSGEGSDAKIEVVFDEGGVNE